jgi:hypothetical protein
MKKIKKAAEYQFWNVVGLLALADMHRKQLEYIEEAIGDTLGIKGETGDYGHISDMVWSGEKSDAKRLLELEETEMP